jgi:hypothetical protein
MLRAPQGQQLSQRCCLFAEQNEGDAQVASFNESFQALNWIRDETGKRLTQPLGLVVSTARVETKRQRDDTSAGEQAGFSPDRPHEAQALESL